MAKNNKQLFVQRGPLELFFSDRVASPVYWRPAGRSLGRTTLEQCSASRNRFFFARIQFSRGSHAKSTQAEPRERSRARYLRRDASMLLTENERGCVLLMWQAALSPLEPASRTLTPCPVLLQAGHLGTWERTPKTISMVKVAAAFGGKANHPLVLPPISSI